MRYSFFLVAAAILAPAAAAGQGVGIGTNAPNPAAVLDLSANDKGLLIPRLDSVQRVGISNPPDGLMVFQKNGRVGFWYWYGGIWIFIPPGHQQQAGDNLGNHTATQNLNLGANQLTGGGASGLRVDAAGNVGIGATPSQKLDVAGKTRTTALQVTGGSPTAGKVLTADASGNATWQDMPPGPVGPAGPVGAAGTSGAYGDGSAGALVINSNTDWSTTPPTNLNFQFSTITVAAGATFIIPSGLVLRCSGNVVVAGTIVVGTAARMTSNAGFRGVAHPGISLAAPDAYPGSQPGVGVPKLMSLSVPLGPFGGGAGIRYSGQSSGGEGGGSFAILAQGTLTVTGAIRAEGSRGGETTSGADNAAGGGGGGGGLVTLLGKGNITVSGLLSVKGGDGGDAYRCTSCTYAAREVVGGGTGEGGIIRLYGSAISATGTLAINSGLPGGSITGTSSFGDTWGRQPAGGASGNGGAAAVSLS